MGKNCSDAQRGFVFKKSICAARSRISGVEKNDAPEILQDFGSNSRRQIRTKSTMLNYYWNMAEVARKKSFF